MDSWQLYSQYLGEEKLEYLPRGYHMRKSRLDLLSSSLPILRHMMKGAYIDESPMFIIFSLRTEFLPWPSLLHCKSPRKSTVSTYLRASQTKTRRSEMSMNQLKYLPLTRRRVHANFSPVLE
jgi:hypothetical protein